MPKLTITRPSSIASINIPVSIKNHVSNLIPIVGVFDTGCDWTTVSRDTMRMLGLNGIGTTQTIQAAGGPVTLELAYISMSVVADDGSVLDLDSHQVAIIENLSTTALLGRELLDCFDVSILRTGIVLISW